MQIIIPMSGFGERFRRAGYKLPKPLIKIDGKPIIAHVIDMFPGETDFIFVCNQDHLHESEYRMEEVLNQYSPEGKIVAIEAHRLGPVHAVLQVQNLLDLAKPVIVNYCDFTCYWDWQNFKDHILKSGCTGSIPAYKGFHPHSLGNTNYAYIREKSGLAQDIQEKQPFTSCRMNEYASSGTYYFNSSEIMINAFNELIEKNLNVAGEYYVSLAYKLLIEKGHSISVYPLQHFMQWGTPEDVSEYKMWSKAFKSYLSPNSLRQSSPTKGAVVIPMAGLGRRFTEEGYELTKPLIPVSGTPMVVQAAQDLPHVHKYVFVIRKDMNGYEDVITQLLQAFPESIIEIIDGVTDGQACTAMIGLEALGDIDAGDLGPITIGACDNGVHYNKAEFNNLLNNPFVDIIVWGIRGFPNAIRNPHMYGWMELDNDLVRSISVKKPIGNVQTSPVVIGTFTFRKSADFCKAFDTLLARNGQVNGEFYIDSLVNDAIRLGLRCYFFEVDNYMCWGTPNDLRTFQYWQSCFHKWDGHPYRLENDLRVPNNMHTKLAHQYSSFPLLS